MGENLIPTRRFYVLRQPLFAGAAPVRHLLPLLPEEQHAQAVAALVDGIDVESPFKGLEGGTDNSRAVLEHYI